MELSSLWTLVQEIYEKGGVMMIPLVLCSLLTMVLIIERALVLRHSYLFPSREVERLRAIATAEGFTAEKLQPTRTYPAGRILDYALRVWPTTSERFKDALFDQARRERHYLERGLILLEIIAGVAPLFGLLGTLLGMIDIFSHLTLTGLDKSQLLSRGISEVLIATITGIVVAIPALTSFSLFNRKIESIGLAIEEEIMFFYYKLFSKAEA